MDTYGFVSIFCYYKEMHHGLVRLSIYNHAEHDWRHLHCVPIIDREADHLSNGLLCCLFFFHFYSSRRRRAAEEAISTVWRTRGPAEASGGGPRPRAVPGPQRNRAGRHYRKTVLYNMLRLLLSVKCRTHSAKKNLYRVSDPKHSANVRNMAEKKSPGKLTITWCLKITLPSAMSLKFC